MRQVGMEPKESETRMPAGEFSTFQRGERADLLTFVGFFVTAGLVNATIAALLVCRLPQSNWLPVRALALRAALYVMAGAVAGVVGAGLYWRFSRKAYRFNSPISFGRFSLICAAGWVWVPAAVLLSTQDSKATVLIGALCGAALGAGLARGMGASEGPPPDSAAPEKNELFAATLKPPARHWRGYLIAGCFYAAGYAQHEAEHLGAGLMCAAGTFLFAWYWKQPVQDPGRRVGCDAAWRLARSGGAAILVTAWALLLGLAHRNASGNAAFAADDGAGADQKAHSGKGAQSSVGPGGFESVILWPFPPKKQLIPPLPEPRNYLGMEKSRPLVIRFDGAYWYFQPPETEPGRTAHQAHGTPLGVNIQAVNTFPLMMEAHQRLIAPVRLSRCGEIDVEIRNRDNQWGEISLGLLLGDSQLPNRPTLYLGKKEIESSMPGFFAYKTAPVSENLRFPIPAMASLRKFDEITVMLLPDFEHSTIGPKIAIEQFELFPR